MIADAALELQPADQHLQAHSQALPPRHSQLDALYGRCIPRPHQRQTTSDIEAAAALEASSIEGSCQAICLRRHPC